MPSVWKLPDPEPLMLAIVDEPQVPLKPKLPPVQERGLATGYAAWKPEWIAWKNGQRLKTSTGKPYCWWYKKVKRGDPIIAHRRLPCGTKVYVTVGRRTKGRWLTVGDRGPYGACVRKSKLPHQAKWWRRSALCRKLYGSDWVWYIKTKRSWPGVWRGIADISHTARRLIGHNGYQDVTLRYWKRQPSSVAQR